MWTCVLGRKFALPFGGVAGSSSKASRPRHYYQHRRFSYQSVLLAIVVLGALLPLLFTVTSFFAMDGAAICCSINLSEWGFFRGGNSKELTKALKLVFLEAEGEDVGVNFIEAAPESFSDLVSDSFSHPNQDMKTFALKTKATLLKMDHKVQLARLRESYLWRVASNGIPKSMHCLTLRLKEEYYMNAMARSPLPPPELISHLDDNSLIHVTIFSDNILAASVVVNSTIKSSSNPKELVFHVITDKKTYAAMHSWFALHPVDPAVIAVKGLHQLDFPSHVSMAMLDTVKLHQRTLKVNARSILSYLWIHLPELFPGLDKVIFLHDDTVVCRDLSPLWSLDLQEKVNGAVSTFNEFRDNFNFSRAEIASQVDPHDYVWVSGVNVFDLKAWRQTSISRSYQHWLKLNIEAGFMLWKGKLEAPAILAFSHHTHLIDSSWHLSGLGLRRPSNQSVKSASVLHFSGPAKPWLEVGFPELRNLWEEHIDFSNEVLKSCSGS